MAGEKWLPAAVVAGMGLGSLGLAQGAAAATLTPVSPTVIAGNTITLTLNDTVAPGSGIAAVDLPVTYDTSLLTLVSVSDGTLLVNWDAPTFNAVTGLISISEGISGDDPVGTGSIVTLTFKALAADPTTTTPLTVQTVRGAVGVSGEYQLLPTSDLINITAAPVTPPTTVPEPGTLVLVLAPMLAAACLTRRDRC